MVSIEDSESFSLKGWSFKEWVLLNKVEVIKLAAALAGIITLMSFGWHPVLAALVAAVLKFGTDVLHYYLNNTTYIKE
jgi:hypothetical protein